MEQLLLSSNGWILDLAFFLILLLGVVFGIRKGFISGVCNLAGWIFSIAFAIFFCINSLDIKFLSCTHGAPGMTHTGKHKVHLCRPCQIPKHMYHLTFYCSRRHSAYDIFLGHKRNDHDRKTEYKRPRAHRTKIQIIRGQKAR